MQEIYDHWSDVVTSVLSVVGVIGSIAFQPMPRTITTKAKAGGGVSHTSHDLSRSLCCSSQATPPSNAIWQPCSHGRQCGCSHPPMAPVSRR